MLVSSRSTSRPQPYRHHETRTRIIGKLNNGPRYQIRNSEGLLAREKAFSISKPPCHERVTRTGQKRAPICLSTFTAWSILVSAPIRTPWSFR